MKKPIITKSQKIVDMHGRPIQAKPRYNSVQTIQEAVNMAVAERRVVRIKTNKSNKQIMTEITDLKNCYLRKPDRDSDELAVIPDYIQDFCFEEQIDTSLVIKRNILL